MDSNIKLKKIGSLKAVKNYMVVDKKGDINFSNFPHPDNIAFMILNCSKNMEIKGHSNVQYQFFAFGDDHFLIFPVGNQYLGVVKNRGTSTSVLAKSILKFLDSQ